MTELLKLRSDDKDYTWSEEDIKRLDEVLDKILKKDKHDTILTHPPA